ncbi:hypothetical protein AB0F18_16995 [Streptomyces sp. NPDC029216]|uniref:hypothetical protein n=1 Tax=Streptomyces sp. NPDC029216 TaxID=3154701 RepID=UPI0033D05487
MSHYVHTPRPTPAKRRMFRYTMVLTSAAFITGGIASMVSPASATTVPHAPPAVKTGALPCPPGHVA